MRSGDIKGGILITKMEIIRAKNFSRKPGRYSKL